jgi:hypothetical protein
VAAGQLGLIGGAQPIFVLFPHTRKTSIQLLLEARQHKKYAQTTPLDDGVSSLLNVLLLIKFLMNYSTLTDKEISNSLLVNNRFFFAYTVFGSSC